MEYLSTENAVIKVINFTLLCSELRYLRLGLGFESFVAVEQRSQVSTRDSVCTGGNCSGSRVMEGMGKCSLSRAESDQEELSEKHDTVVFRRKFASQ